jgi:GTP-binding protein HflX
MQLDKVNNIKDGERGVLVAVCSQHQPIEKTNEYLEELAELARTLDIEVVKRFVQHIDAPNVKTFIGSGKVEEIRLFLEQDGDVTMVVFDDDLSASQVRNLEELLKCKVVDRNLLILDIFAMRAQTAQAKTQVELAQYEYLLPRLTRMWTHLSRQKGGIGMRGPGERELETDRRIVKQKIALLKDKLEHIERQTETQRKMRDRLVRVAIVGYTNAGKSTLMNVLSKSHVLAEDKLFATLDSTVRKVVINGLPFLLSDTVGFIRKLPHTLIECFKSTLTEVASADLLLHVVDISSHSYLESIEVVNATLKEIKSDGIPVVMVFNKLDKVKLPIEDIRASIDNVVGIECPVTFVSAISQLNIDELKKIIYENIIEKHYEIYPNYLSDE